MVYLTGAQSETRSSVKSGSPDVMFDASAWRIRSIWDGVKLEVAGDASPVVLHSFTQLDPDLPLLEVMFIMRWSARRRQSLLGLQSGVFVSFFSNI